MEAATTRPDRRRRFGAVAGGLALLAGLAACAPASDDPRAVTADEDRQLNDAAARLDANGLAPAAHPSTTNQGSQP